MISATINKYSYITARPLPPFFDYKYRIRYYVQEEAKAISEIKHPSVRECSNYLNFQGGLEIVHNADLPARSGLGSSSTFTVGMLHALHSLQNYMPTKRELALQAIHIEQEQIGEAVGSQDQTAAAFGGMNHIQFNATREIDVDPVIISRERMQQLEQNLLLVFTGFSRTASEIAQTQIELSPRKTKELLRMKEICNQALVYLTNEAISLDEFGKLLNEQWQLKKSMSNLITNTKIDEIYHLGLTNGALGGKLLGAGGGGFMLFYCPEKYRHAVLSCLGNKMFVPFRFESTGSKIIYYSHE
ncbi:GHMP family kinase ATP-binding protein [Rheinheimera sp.]|uniref:GHMP family kinase ATP-binding protein n=1 Tax=Rheinheimera sp. TaxID=1869214 RepID=UPI004048DF4E